MDLGSRGSAPHPYPLPLGGGEGVQGADDGVQGPNARVTASGNSHPIPLLIRWGEVVEDRVRGWSANTQIVVGHSDDSRLAANPRHGYIFLPGCSGKPAWLNQNRMSSTSELSSFAARLRGFIRASTSAGAAEMLRL